MALTLGKTWTKRRVRPRCRPAAGRITEKSCVRLCVSAARCPHCEHNKAYFMQKQIRSADEPMTIFYKCVECGGRWNE